MSCKTKFVVEADDDVDVLLFEKMADKEKVCSDVVMLLAPGNSEHTKGASAEEKQQAIDRLNKLRCRLMRSPMYRSHLGLVF